MPIVCTVKKGLNLVRIEYEGNPGDMLEWKFTPGQIASDYISHDIPEARKLRQKERGSHSELKATTI
jgi:hypothetical protein